MVFIATTHEYEAGLDNKLIRERRIRFLYYYKTSYDKSLSLQIYKQEAQE